MKPQLFLLLLVLSVSVVAQKTRTVPKYTALTLTDVQKVFVDLPIAELRLYNEKSDPDSKLGRPGQYAEKMIFTDRRIKNEFKESIEALMKADPKMAEEMSQKYADQPWRWLECSIEVFPNRKNLDAHYWFDLREESIPYRTKYLFFHKNVVLKLDFALTPEQAAEYEAALKTL